MAAELTEIAAICDTLVREMDFRFLYHPRKKVLSVGYDVGDRRLEPSYYDLLASEARIAVFVAIAKGDIPQEAWFHLGRGHTLCRGERILLSWTGTMFEYLMPALWMRHYPGTIMEQSIRAVVRVAARIRAPQGRAVGHLGIGVPGRGAGELRLRAVRHSRPRARSGRMPTRSSSRRTPRSWR